jgi:3-demethoxyubiquinol 3-hydroxylase
VALPVYVRHMDERRYSPLDRLLGHFDEAMRTVFASPHAQRANPADTHEDAAVEPSERELAARLMRVNHCGEICAQALYQGQALTARSAEVRVKMEQAAQEENDHLAWTETRIRDLGSHTSYLNPLWYAGSFALGAGAGLIGDRWSLGFLAETERQVVTHLDSHLARLPAQDHKSRAIVEQMRADESKHATVAIEAGAAELPTPIKQLMRLTSKIMTTTAHWI